MQRVFRRGLGSRVRSFDGEDAPDPYDDAYETPEGFVGAILDGAGGGDQSRRRSPRRRLPRL